LDKPLTARLMLIPGKQAGELTSFDFGYFANSRLMALKAEPLGKAQGGNEMFELRRRKVKEENMVNNGMKRCV
jgi:hypothetical protein